MSKKKAAKKPAVMAKRKIPVPTVEQMLERVRRDPGELTYFEVLVDVVESCDFKDHEIVRSATLSRVAVTCPWLLECTARRAA